MWVTTPFGPAIGQLFSNCENTYLYKRCECNIYKNRRKYINQKLCLYLNMELFHFRDKINFNILVSLVLCNHENIKVMSHLLVIFFLYLSFILFRFAFPHCTVSNHKSQYDDRLCQL